MFRALIVATILTGLSGCANYGGPAPEDTPKMYQPGVADADQEARCVALYDEVTDISYALGEPAYETPIPPPPTAGQRTWSYVRDLTVQTVIGPIQPVIQTWRAATNAEAKEASAALGRERALIRRAYLIGSMETAGCGMDVPSPE